MFCKLVTNTITTSLEIWDVHLREDDILGIGTENVKVLNIDVVQESELKRI